MPIDMRLRPTWAAMRWTSLAVAGVLVTAVSVAVITAHPGRAFAAPTATDASSIQIGWTDSATPGQAFDLTNGANLPLGSHVDSDGTVHTSRIHATYDLSPYLDQHLVSASIFVNGASAADCSVRAIEAWNTKVIAQTPTWADPPKEVTKQDEILTPASFCRTS